MVTKPTKTEKLIVDSTTFGYSICLDTDIMQDRLDRSYKDIAPAYPTLELSKHYNFFFLILIVSY